MLTGGDTIRARDLFSSEISFKPTHTIFLLTNYKPRADTSDYALWKRIHFIPFTERFVSDPSGDHEHDVNPNILDELKEEASGILAWLVRGLLKYQEEGLNPPPEVLAAKKQYRAEEDTIGQFVAERGDIGEGKSVQAGEFQQEYRDWCKHNKRRAESMNKVAEWLLQRGYKRDDSKRHRLYLGIGLRPEE